MHGFVCPYMVQSSVLAQRTLYLCYAPSILALGHLSPAPSLLYASPLGVQAPSDAFRLQLVGCTCYWLTCVLPESSSWALEHRCAPTCMRPHAELAKLRMLATQRRQHLVQPAADCAAPSALLHRQHALPQLMDNLGQPRHCCHALHSISRGAGRLKLAGQRAGALERALHLRLDLRQAMLPLSTLTGRAMTWARSFQIRAHAHARLALSTEL